MNRSQHLCLMASYNADMNAKVYAGANNLSSQELEHDRKAFFGSILGTLNHLIVADLIWLKRFASHPAAFPSLQVLHTMKMPAKLDEKLHIDLPSLSAQSQQLDQIIKAFTAEIKEEDLDLALAYETLAGEKMRKNMFSLLMHFFNHQTHHRGQVMTLLFQAGVDVGVTDLNAWVPQAV